MNANGKGDGPRTGADYKKYREGWDTLWGKKEETMTDEDISNAHKGILLLDDYIQIHYGESCDHDEECVCSFYAHETECLRALWKMLEHFEKENK